MRERWSQNRRNRTDNSGNAHVTDFRSDNDLKQLRFEWAGMSGITAVSLGLMAVWNPPLAYWALIFAPALLLLLLSRWSARRNRLTGRRFSHYNDEGS